MHTRFAIVAGLALAGTALGVGAAQTPPKATAAPMVVYKSPT